MSKKKKSKEIIPLLSIILSLAVTIIISTYYFVLKKPTVSSYPEAYGEDYIIPYKVSYGYIYYNQNDAPWGPISLDSGKCTFSSIGCGTTVTASIVSTKKNSTAYNPSYIYKTNYPNLTCSGFGVQDVATILHLRYNISTTQVSNKNANALQNAVANNAKSGKKMIIGAKIKTPHGTVNHVTMVVGYDSRSKAMIFNDPMYGAGIKLEKMSGYSVDWSSAIVYIVN